MWGIHSSQSKLAYRAPPESTAILHTVFSTTWCCTGEYFRCIVLSASCNELRLMAPSMAAVSYFDNSCLVDLFQLHLSYTEFLIFRLRPTLFFLPAFFLIAGLHCCSGYPRMLLLAGLILKFYSHRGEILELFAKIKKEQQLRAHSVGRHNSTGVDEARKS